jgi:hypothetical protein
VAHHSEPPSSGIYYNIMNSRPKWALFSTFSLG